MKYELQSLKVGLQINSLLGKTYILPLGQGSFMCVWGSERDTGQQ